MFWVIHFTVFNCSFATFVPWNSMVKMSWFAYRNGWLMLGKGDTTIEIIESDVGLVYAVVEIPSGQDYYVDWAETKQKPKSY
jgi:hypothetical protein